MRDRIVIIFVAMMLGGLLGGGGILLLVRGTHAAQEIDGQPMKFWVRCLESESADLRGRAVAALPKFGADAIKPTIAALDRPRASDAASDTLAMMGPAAVPALLDAMQHGSAAQRSGVVRAIDRMSVAPSPLVLASVTRLLGDESAGAVAAGLIVRVGVTPEAVSAARDLLGHGDKRQQLTALRVLDRARVTDASLLKEIVVVAVRDSDSEVREAALDVLCAMNPPPADAARALVASLGKGDRRRHAPLALIGAPAIRLLRNASTHPSAMMRHDAVEVLSQLRWKHAPARDALAEFLKDRDPAVKSIALQGLETVPKLDPDFVREQLSAATPEVRVWAIERAALLKPAPLMDLSERLIDPDPRVRSAAVANMRIPWGEEERVVLAVRSPDAGDRARGVRLLPWLPGDAKYELIDAALADSSPQVRQAAVLALGQSMTRGKTLKQLCEVMKTDSSPAVRADAAAQLRAARDVGSVRAALESATADVDDRVATAARQALGR